MRTLKFRAMTPKEKALEFCQKFGYLGMKWEQTHYYTLDLENAKQCALICVEEIISLCASGLSETSYWQQVK